MIQSMAFTRNGTLPLANLFSGAQKITTGAPSATTTAGKMTPGALIPNLIDGTLYINTGSTASPVWTLIENAGAFALPATGTDTVTTIGTSFSLTFSALTSGVGQKLTGSGALMTTAGIVQSIVMGAATVGAGQVITSTGVYAGTGISKITATGQTSGVLQLLTGGGANMTASGQISVIAMGAATTGQGQQITTTGLYTGLNGIWQLTANSATTGTVGRINATGLSSGNAFYAVGGGANMISGGNVGNFDMGAGIAGSAVLAQTLGVYTGTDGVQLVYAPNATTGIISKVSVAGLTSGIGHQVVATAATLTTGRYYSANNGTTEVFGVGPNGHLISTAGSGPGILITVNQGISAVALALGSTDTCGTITSTGTQNNTADSTFTLTFGKTYTTVPKGVVVTAANASAALAAQSGIYVASVSATAVVFGVPKSSAAGATPSWNYIIIS